MAKKTNKTTQQLLVHFRDLCEVSKTNIVTQLNTAIAQNTISFASETDAQRALSLISSLLDVENAETYMKLQNFSK
tara:strand:- start:823 stop:1050 length:228 start_codon:yes stop_codon:yes gene_type:complete